MKLSELAESPNISPYRLHTILEKLQDLDFIEPTGKTSGLAYILHITKRKSSVDKVEYVMQKKQEKARQKEAILRYIDEIGRINNPEARALLKLQDKDAALVSKLFKSMLGKEIMIVEKKGNNNIYWKEEMTSCLNGRFHF